VGFLAGAFWSVYAMKTVDNHFHVKSVVLKTSFLLLVLIISRYTASIHQPLFIAPIYNIMMLLGLLLTIGLFVYLIRLNTKYSWVFAIFMSVSEGVFLGMAIALIEDGMMKHALHLSLSTTIGVFFGLTLLYLDDVLRKGSMARRVKIGLIVVFFPAAFFAVYYGIESDLFEGPFFYFYLAIFLISYVFSTIYLIEDFNQVTKHLNNEISYKYEFLLSIGLLLGIIFVYVKFIWMLLTFFLTMRRTAVESKNRRKNVKRLYTGSLYDTKHSHFIENESSAKRK